MKPNDPSSTVKVIRGAVITVCIILLLLWLTGALSNSAKAATLVPPPPALDPAIAARIKTAVSTNTKGQVVPLGVAATPVPGLFEVSTPELDIFYVDPEGRYGLVDGRLLDLRSKEDLTNARLQEIRRVDFAKLPLQLAIKTTRGNGRRVLAIFEDPTCPGCRSIHRFISQIPDSTVYHFVYPVISKESVPIAASAWCAPDRAHAWEQVMTTDTVPDSKRACNVDGIEQTVQLAESLHVGGTPTMILADGTRLAGTVPPEDLMRALEASAAKTGAAVARR